MGFSIGLTQDDIDYAHKLVDLRYEYTKKFDWPQPKRKDGDFIGCLAEVAGCKAWGFQYSDLGYDHTGGGGDGGKDFTLADGTTIDIKSSADHADSWLVKNPRADWYVFAYVEPPYHVHFMGKQERQFIADLPLFKLVRGSRRVFLEQLMPIAVTDFVVG